MADRRPISPDGIVALLDDVRPLIAVPDATGVADAVRRRIEAEPRPTVGRSRSVARRHQWLVAAAVVVIVVAALVLAVPASRDAVADWLGLRGVRIEQSDESTDALRETVGTDLRLGRPTTLAAARRAVDFPVAVPPREYGAPTAVYLGARPAGGRVTLLYAPTAALPPAGRDDVGLLITQFTADLDEGVFRKMLGSDSTVELVPVGDATGYWISGGPHVVGLTDRDGNIYRDSTRLAGNTLLFEAGGRTIRIESGLSQAEAVALAEQLVGGR